MARNILASPRAPSCVLNHFPVDSAVCNPIIGVSPPGKLLFYSRTTRAPGVYRDIPCLPFLPSPLPSSRRLRRFSIPCLHLPSIVGDFDVALRSLFSFSFLSFFFSSFSLFLPFFLYLSRFLPFQGGENPGRESSPVFALLKSIVNIYPVIVTGGTHKGGGMSLRGEEIFVLLERNRQRDMIRGKGGLGSDGYTVWII